MNETEYLLALQDWNQKTSLRWPLNNVAPSILAILILIQLKPTLNRNLLLVSAIAKIETGIVYLIFTNLSIFKGLKGEVYGVWGYLMVGLCTPGWLISETSIVLSNGLRCFYICGDQKYKKVYKISAGILIVCEIFWRIYGATFSQISDDVNKPNAVIAMINTFTWGTNAVADLIICIRILWFTVYQLKCSSVQKSTKTIYKVILHSAEMRLVFFILPIILLSALNFQYEHMDLFLKDPLIESNILVHNISAFYFENSCLIFSIDLLLSKMKLYDLKTELDDSTAETDVSENVTENNC